MSKKKTTKKTTRNPRQSGKKTSARKKTPASGKTAEEQRPAAVQASSDKPTVIKQVVRLPELFPGREPGPDILSNTVFVDCLIVGPGVLVLIGGVEMNGVIFEDPNVFFPLEDDRSYYGMIGVSDCAFYQCRFERVGIATSPSAVENMLAIMNQPEA